MSKTRSLMNRLVLLVLIGAGMFVPPTLLQPRAQSSSLFAAYSFSETSGTIAIDHSGNGHDATLTNGTTRTTNGFIGSGVIGDGVNDIVQLPFMETPALRDAFTLEAWIAPAHFDAIRYLWTGDNVSLILWSDGHFYGYASLTGGFTSIGSTPIPRNTWTHVAMTYNGAALRLYLNGVMVDDEPASGSLPDASTLMQLGYDGGGGFSGGLDEVRIYDRALTGSEIALDLGTPVDPAAPLQVTLKTPANGAVGVLTTPVTMTFSQAIDASTLTANTFLLQDSANTTLPATLNYDGATRTATLTPNTPLASLADYTVRVVAGASGVASVTAATMAADTLWTFRTAAADTTPSIALAFSEGAGTVAADSSGNGNHAALLNGPPAWTTRGHVGKGLVGDGVDDIVVLPVTETLNLTSAFTFEAWVSPDNFNRARYLWSTPHANLILFPGGYFYGYITATGGFTSIGSPAIPLQAWTHVAMTYDGAAVRLYLDDILVDIEPASGTLPTSLQPMTLGDGGGGFSGGLDEVRMYRRALNATEIALDMVSGVDPILPAQVTDTYPSPGAVGVTGSTMTASFSRPMDGASFSPSTVLLTDSSGAAVPAGVAYVSASRTATITPSNPLASLADYTVRIVGGTGGVSDATGTAMASDYSWTFRTAAAETTPSAVYGFSEGTGTIADDSSGNGNHATLVNGPAWTTSGHAGNALLGDGIDDAVVLPATETLRLTNAFTFETWISPSDFDRIRYLWSGANVALILWSDGHFYGYASLTGGFTSVGAPPIPLNTWTHVAMTYNGAALRLYINGALVDDEPASGALPVAVQPMTLADGAGGFAGGLDEVRIYRTALSAAAIVADMTTPADSRQPAISSLNPTSGPIGQTVTISGANFGDTQDSTTVTFNGAVAATTAWSAASIVALVPPDATTGPVVVTRLGLSSNGPTFTVVAPPPPLAVIAKTPLNFSLGIVNPIVTATFDRAVDPATLTSQTFKLYSYHTFAFVPATVSYDSGTRTAILTPMVALWPLTRHNITVAGGPGGVTDTNGVEMLGNIGWTFTTAADASRPSLAYRFDGSDDDSENGNTPTVVGDPLTVPGWFGKALAFNGVDDELDTPLSQTLVVTNAVTFESWIYPTANGGHIWSQFNTAAAPLQDLALLPAGTVQFNAVTTSGTFSVTSTSAIPLNAWAHVALSYDGASLRLYVNGALAASATASGSLVQSAEPIRFGVGFTGSLDEIRIYRRVLSAGEITLDMSTPIHINSPVITSVTPNTGVVGQAIAINGANFNAVQGDGTVTLNSLPMTVTAWNSWQITAIVPPPVFGVSGTSIRVAVGARTSNSGTFALLVPTISSLGVSASWVGQEVVITGSGFPVTQGSTTVTINGVQAQISAWSQTSLTIIVPPTATTGSVIVTVFGKASNAKPLTILPHISAMSAASGVIGQTLTLTGTTFGATKGASTVTFNGTLAAVTNWSNTSISVTAPQNAGGAERILVTVGGLASNPGNFWIDPVASIIAISPATGIAGQAVGITGSNFWATQDSSTVLFNGVVAPVLSWTDAAIVVAVPNGAVTGPVVVTVNGHPSNGLTFSMIQQQSGAPLSIASDVTPAPSAAGWYGSAPVNVHFTCTDSAAAVTSCIGNTAVWTAGTNIAVGAQATDAAGNKASLTLLLNVDLEPPQLSVLSPAPSALFPSGTSTVVISGTAADGLSGLQSVMCGSIAATIANQTYTCSVNVADGTTPVHVVATDNAGHSTARDASIRVGDIAPTAFSVSPAKMTLMVGWGQQLRVMDDLGRTVTGGAWSVSDTAIADVVINNDVAEVHALAPGTSALTFAKGGLSATATVAVLAATSTTFPAGTTLWELNATTPAPLPGSGATISFQRGEVLRAMATNSSGASLYFVEHSLYDSTLYGDNSQVWPTRIRATSADGQELWKYTPSAPARQVATDNVGGLILNLGRPQGYGNLPTTEHTIQHLRGDGVVTWEYWPASPSSTVSEVAIRPDGTVFFVETGHSASLIALDGESGARVATWPLYSNASGPLVREDGSVVVATFRQGGNPADRSLWLATVPPDHPTIAFAQVNIENVSEDYPLGSCCLHFDLKAALATGTERNHLIPDGHGGLLLPVSVQGYSRTVIYRIDATNTVAGTVQINQGDAQIVIGDDAAWVLAQEPNKTEIGTPALLMAFDPVSLAVLSSQNLLYDTPNPGQDYTAGQNNTVFHNYYKGPNLALCYANAGGGVTIADPRAGNTCGIASEIVAGWATGPTLQFTDPAVARTIQPYPRGDGGRIAAVDPFKGIFVQGYPLYVLQSHSAIRVIPQNQNRWSVDSRFRRDTAGIFFLTIGAESNTGGCGGLLTSGINRTNDLTIPLGYFDRALYRPDQEDSIIEALLSAFGNYHQHDDARYACFPTTTDNTYNSNSYAHGLANVAGIIAPVPYSVLTPYYPGWSKPLPPSQFQPH